MSYGVSAALQGAVYQALMGDAALAALVGDAIHDALPTGPVPPLYVALGPEVVRDRSDKTGAGAEHDITVSVVASTAGFAQAKAAAGAVSDALSQGTLTLVRGQLAYLNFQRARARRGGSGDERRIDLIFRARVSDD